MVVSYGTAKSKERSSAVNAEIVIFGGSAHPELADEICRYLSVPRSPVRISRFANDCLQVQLQANCRERDVYLIQPLVAPVQENLVELLLMADAARGASAARVTAVMPHYSYARSDKKDAPRISIGGRLVADLLVTAGVNRVLTLTLHSAEVHGFFSVPVDHLHALRELAAHFSKKDLSNAVVLSPDLGYAKSAAAFARRLGLPVAAGAKERFSDNKVTISAIIGEVADRDVIIVDDEIARGTTVIELLSVLRRQEVRSISIACTHGLFADGALEKLAAAEDVPAAQRVRQRGRLAQPGRPHPRLLPLEPGRLLGHGLLLGFRPTAGPVEWIAAAGMFALLTLALTWLTVAFGLLAKTPAGANSLALIPAIVPFVSSAFIPTAAMSGPVRWFAQNEPFTSIIDTLRGLLTGTGIGDSAIIAIAWCAGLTLAAYFWARALYNRRRAA